MVSFTSFHEPMTEPKIYCAVRNRLAIFLMQTWNHPKMCCSCVNSILSPKTKTWKSFSPDLGQLKGDKHRNPQSSWPVTSSYNCGGGGGGGIQYRQRTYFGNQKDILRKFITKCDWRYYEVRQLFLLQSATRVCYKVRQLLYYKVWLRLLQSATGIIKCDDWIVNFVANWRHFVAAQRAKRTWLRPFAIRP